MSDAEKYLLSEQESQKIFDNIIAPDIFNEVPTSLQPTAYLLGGQPASGKTAVTNNLFKQHGKDNIILINGDDFRNYHPKYSELVKEDAKTAAFFTDKDSGRWVEKTIEYGRKLGVNMIIEGTMRNPAVPEKTAALLHSAGYKVEAVAMAVPERESWLGVHKRFEVALAAGQPARFSVRQSHDAALFGMLDTLDQIHTKKTVDKLSIVTRNNEVLYTNSLVNGEWQNPMSARKTVLDYRLRPVSEEKQAEHLKEWDRIIQQMQQRGASAQDIERTKKYKANIQGGFKHSV